MKGSILVTGASGFLGKGLVHVLRERGETVIARSSQDGDIAREELKANGVRHVFHLAAETYVPDSWREPRRFYEVNVLGTVNVLEFCRKNNTSLTLLSSYVYGKPERLPISEDHPLRAFNPYGHSKLLAEEAARFYETAYGISLSIVRPFNFYGPSQSGSFLIPTVIRQALSSDTAAISVADLRPRRDYIYVEDVVDLLICLLEHPEKHGVYNAGSGVSTGVREVCELIARLTGTRKALVSRGEERPDEVLETVADIGRARSELNWSPKISLEEGLKRTILAAAAANSEPSLVLNPGRS
jgi:nucleoside-diphosphate-sugar epimerase